MNITKESFGITQKGEQVERYLLENKKGTKVAVLTYGAIVQSLVFQGVDVVLGFDTISDYEKQDAYMGAVVGRFANRIGNGKFVLNETEYNLCINNGPNHLHGGREGFDRKLWHAEAEECGLSLSYRSPDGEEGYPGDLDTVVTYSLDEEDGLRIRYTAHAHGDTVVNLTNHSYFNLSGHSAGNIQDHEVQIFAESFTENDMDCLPTGEIRRVSDTPMDFRRPCLLMGRIKQEYDQLVFGNGYDHNWVISGEGIRPCAVAKSLTTGIKMTVTSDQPGMQMYTANFLELTVLGKNGVQYPRRSAVCFETQGFPNATRHSHFPSPVLRRGNTYDRTTIYRFTK